MNNIQMPTYEELNYSTKSSDTLKIFIIGNSITTHGIANEIGWNHKSGMAASTHDKDYVHLLFKQLKMQYSQKNIKLRYSNWSLFERMPNKFSNFRVVEKFKPNIVIYQLGDNTASESSELFKKSSIRFLKPFENKFVLSPFFMSPDNFKASKEIALKSNSTFINISSISKNKINTAAKDSNRSDVAKWTVEGISAHPGDTGMLNISNEIFRAIILKN
ncbi:hypothetical protein [Chryseobacterium sp.]|uniref:hypothetical protein n=1 Tax=Chryseobacterium sp. TaxID=1871047 RepID=UPI00260A1CA5|nr:hypothetical protein [Chryseobacterium sp.]